MAIFPLKKVAKLAGTHAVYLRGIACYNAGKVQNVPHPYSDHAAESIAGQVVSSDWESTYDVAVDFDHRGEAAHYSCTCKAFSRYDGACKHIVALLAYKYYHDMLGNVTTARQLMPVDDSNIAVKAMLDGFLDAAQTQLEGGALRAGGGFARADADPCADVSHLHGRPHSPIRGARHHQVLRTNGAACDRHVRQPTDAAASSCPI
mgnify:CR=1 FL=1